MRSEIEAIKVKDPNAPILAQSILDLSKHMKVSFHALPIGSLADDSDMPFSDYFRELLADRRMSEITITSPFLDTLVSPEAAIARAEEAAAQLFGADGTLFVSSGTTTSNQIVIEALSYKRDARFLVDKTVHQSIHFALESRRMQVQYIVAHEVCENSG